MEEITTTDNGETEVHFAAYGDIVGSDAEGNPVTQHFTEEALKRIASEPEQEYLVDKDHASMRPGVSCESEAMGWLSKLRATADGLFGTIKWTELGRKLVESRAYRFLSPVFRLDSTNTPTELVNVALTNRPSQVGMIKPIINSISDMGNPIVKPEEFQPIEKGILDMTREELAAMVAAMIDEALKAKEASNSCAEEVENEVPEEKPAEEAKAPEEKPAEEVEKEVKEVIKLETLNSSPVIAVGISGKNEMDAWFAENRCSLHVY